MKVFEGTDNEYYMDGYLNSNLETAKRIVKKDMDMVFLVDGSEGVGKSVLAMGSAFFCDPTLTLDRIVFTPKEFRKAIIGAKKYQAVIYDEAYTGLSSRATMSLINRTLISMLAEIRQKNLFVFVVMPCFFDLDRYVALWRSRGLLHAYFGDDFERGFFAFFNVDRKKDLYINGKKYYSYSKPKPNFIGRFTNHYVIDEKAYRKKKKESLISREKKREEDEIRKELENMLFLRLCELDDISHTIKIKILDVPSSTYFYKLKQFNEGRDLL